MSKEKSMAMGGVNSLSQSRSVTAHPDILKTLGWVKERTSNSVIVESGKTSTGWWRKWSDGFIEQGGSITLKEGVNTTITFLKMYTDTSYTALFMRNKQSGWEQEAYVSFLTQVVNIVDKTDKGFTVSDPSFGVSRDVSWFACGF